jgi:hypothetical protein
MTKDFEDFCEDKARAGDGQYAIAFALMQLARETRFLGKGVRDLGNGDAASNMGAIEGLAVMIKEAAQTIADSNLR